MMEIFDIRQAELHGEFKRGIMTAEEAVLSMELPRRLKDAMCTAIHYAAIGEIGEEAYVNVFKLDLGGNA